MAKTVLTPDQALKHFNLDPNILAPTPAEVDIESHITQDEAGNDVLELTEEETAILYDEVAVIDLALERLTERREAIKSIFRRLDYGTTTIDGAQGKVLIGHNPVFNEARFLLAFPYDFSEIKKVVEQDKRGRDIVVDKLVYPNRVLYKITPDRPAIKLVLGAEVAATFYDEGAKKVTIK